MKRRIKQNVWGNWKAYLGTRRVHDFGTDESAARDWLEFGEWIGYTSDPARLGEGATYWLQGGEVKSRPGCPDWAKVKYPANGA